MQRIQSACLALGMLLSAATVYAQEAEPEASTPPGPAQAGPVDPFDRGTPRSSMRAYLEACRAGDYERAAEHLDLRRIRPEEGGPELARQLKVVLDRTLWVELDDLAADPEGRSEDGLPWYRDFAGTIPSEEGDVPLYLDRVPRGDDGVRVWKIAGTTLARVPELFEEHGYGPLGELLPSPFFEIRFLEIELWQWIGLLVLVVAAYLISWLVARGLIRVAAPLVSRTDTQLDDRLIEVTGPPLRFLIAVGIVAAALFALGLSLPVERFFGGALKGLVVVGVTWLFFRTIDVAEVWMADELRRRGQPEATSLLPMGRRTVKAVLSVLAFLAVLQNVGVNVTGLLAGLGVGGLAVALAAQRTLENLFGGVTLLVDQPVRVGDFCRFDDKIGTIEDIGLRSTRVRTLDRTVVTVPNAEFSRMQLENFAKRDMIWFHPTIGVRYETTPDQMRFILVEVRRMLYAHPRVDPDPARIRFTGFGSSSLDLSVFAYVRTTDYNDYLEVCEDLNLRLMDIVERAGSGFAFPSQTLYVGGDDGLDASKAREAESRVESWRSENALPLPAFPPEQIRELAGTLDYPNRGSALRGEPTG